MILISLNVPLAEDFDFEFIEGTIEQSTDEMNEALKSTLSDLTTIIEDAMPIEGCQDISA